MVTWPVAEYLAVSKALFIELPPIKLRLLNTVFVESFKVIEPLFDKKVAAPLLPLVFIAKE